MLDKGQIRDWDGAPEAKGEATGPRSIAGRIMEGREAVPTGERVLLTPEQVHARKRRGQWLALALFAFVIIVFVLTMSKVGGGLPERM
jgi:hypothetical protein